MNISITQITILVIIFLLNNILLMTISHKLAKKIHDFNLNLFINYFKDNYNARQNFINYVDDILDTEYKEENNDKYN